MTIPRLAIRSAARSHVGMKRPANEDTFVADDRLGLYAVADGMGGHAAGEVASALAAQTVLGLVRAASADRETTWPPGFDPTLSFEGNQLKAAVQLANRDIVAKSAASPELQGMGSTLVACLVRHDSLVFVNVGDSRLYLWRGGSLRQVSQDDSWASSMLRAGASAESVSRHPMRHVLTRALGASTGLEINVETCVLDAGDLVLLCSDGLYGPAGDAGIARVLAQPDATIDTMADALIDAANAAGGPDNITVVLIRASEA